MDARLDVTARGVDLGSDLRPHVSRRKRDMGHPAASSVVRKSQPRQGLDGALSSGFMGRPIPERTSGPRETYIVRQNKCPLGRFETQGRISALSH
jgi:hypothetical protein